LAHIIPRLRGLPVSPKAAGCYTLRRAPHRRLLPGGDRVSGKLTLYLLHLQKIIFLLEMSYQT
jgi:hypothetical protein